MRSSPIPTVASESLCDFTPPESVSFDLQDKLDSFSNTIPSAGSTFLILSAQERRVVSVVGGKIVLSEDYNDSASKWKCEESNGYLGFRNCASGLLLGRDKNWKLSCFATRHRNWEWFRAYAKPEGYVLIMPMWDELYPVGYREEGRRRFLSTIKNWESEPILWKFSEVY